MKSFIEQKMRKDRFRPSEHIRSLIRGDWEMMCNGGVPC
jgi:hypothetical protein